MTPALDKIIGLFPALSEADQLALTSYLVQSHPLLQRSDGYVDALAPVDAAFDAAYPALDHASSDAVAFGKAA